VLEAAAAAVGLAGAVAALLTAQRLCRVSALVGDKSICLNGYAFVAYAAGLLVETLSLLAAAAAMHSQALAEALGRPELVTRILSGRGVLLAAPFYAISYSLAAAALYVEHVELPEQGRAAAAALPLIAQLYVDYNLVLLLLLAAAMALAYERYRPPLARFMAFYGVAAASHVVALLLPMAASPEVVYASLLLRGAAPIVFQAVARAGRGAR